MKPMPLNKVLEQVRELISKGYNPTRYLAYFDISDDGAVLKPEFQAKEYRNAA